MKTVLQIEGMSCEHCVKHLAEVLEGVPGVKSASVNLKKKRAEVKHGDEATLDALKAAVDVAGFTVVA